MVSPRCLVWAGDYRERGRPGDRLRLDAKSRRNSQFDMQGLEHSAAQAEGSGLAISAMELRFGQTVQLSVEPVMSLPAGPVSEFASKR